MDKDENQKLYVEAAMRSRCKPMASEEKLWFEEFRYADARDLKAALGVFFERAAAGDKGVWMPKPDELQPLVNAARGRRTSMAFRSNVFTVFRCVDCNVTRSGWIDPHDADPRRCASRPNRPSYQQGEICGGRMNVILRDTEAA